MHGKPRSGLHTDQQPHSVPLQATIVPSGESRGQAIVPVPAPEPGGSAWCQWNGYGISVTTRLRNRLPPSRVGQHVAVLEFEWSSMTTRLDIRAASL